MVRKNGIFPAILICTSPAENSSKLQPTARKQTRYLLNGLAHLFSLSRLEFQLASLSPCRSACGSNLCTQDLKVRVGARRARQPDRGRGGKARERIDGQLGTRAWLKAFCAISRARRDPCCSSQLKYTRRGAGAILHRGACRRMCARGAEKNSRGIGKNREPVVFNCVPCARLISIMDSALKIDCDGRSLFGWSLISLFNEFFLYYVHGIGPVPRTLIGWEIDSYECPEPIGRESTFTLFLSQLLKRA